MKMGLTIISAVLCSIGLLAFAPSSFLNKGEVVRAEVNASSVETTGSAKSREVGSNPSLKLVLDRAIPLNILPEETYLGKFRFTQDGSIYFSTQSLEPRRSVISKITEGREREILATFGGTDGDLISIDVDGDGIIYTTLQFPNRTGSIVLLASDGSLLSRIETGSFLPSEIMVDPEKRIWVVGQEFDSLGAHLIDVQVRVYRARGKGKLLISPLGGLEIDDSGFSVFSYVDKGTQFITNSRLAIFDFGETRCIGAHPYPFQSSDEPVNQRADARLFKRDHLVKGIARVAANNIWYGAVRDSQNPNVYSKSFIGLSTISDEPLTPEIDLPSNYGSLVGVDHKGYIYMLAKEAGQIVLSKFRVEILSGGRSVFQTETK